MPTSQTRTWTDAYTSAREYLMRAARDLECTRFNHAFDGSDVDPIYEALAPYQNADGGFGNALEPDVRCEASTAIATAAGLCILAGLEAPEEQPLVVSGMRFLRESFDGSLRGWRGVPREVNEAPHAPWWTVDGDTLDNWDNYRSNPRPELVGYLFTWPGLSDVFWREELLEETVKYAKSLDAFDMHGALCYLQMARNEFVPLSARDTLLELLEKHLPTLVVTNPEKWGEYGLSPLWIVDGPDAPFADKFGDAARAELEWLLPQQREDGSWGPPWSWFGTYEDEWKIAEREWAGILTLRTLLAARNFGLLGG